MSRLVFLLEEPSMRTFLNDFLPRHFPDLNFLCVAHEGKHDLEKSIPRKLRAWQEPGVRFVVVRDNDGTDCVATKARLAALCQAAGRPDTLVRLACQELEAWYLGDLEALADGFGIERLRSLTEKEAYRDPDSISKPSAELARLVPAFQKVSGARLLATRLGETNRSHSFQVFLAGIRRAMANPAQGGEN